MSPDGRERRITDLLGAVREGDRDAIEDLTSQVYDELRRLARIHMRGERANHTLQPTGLVHEAFMRLLGGTSVDYKDRNHFFAIASITMRRLLVNWAQRKRTAKRGGGLAHSSPTDVVAPLSTVAPETILAVDGALERLSEVSERAARVVECRYFGGLTIEETAETLGVSRATVKREWVTARTWLQRELG